jgi:N-dimethylarginine dimethylaminohydrolase
MRWLADTFEMDIIGFPIVDSRLYHLDGSLLPIDEESVVLCRERATTEAGRAIESACEVIPVSLREALAGISNSLVMDGCFYCDTTIATIQRDDPWYDEERLKVRAAERICRAKGLDLTLVDIAEFYKSGAGLSCLVMRLNARAY